MIKFYKLAFRYFNSSYRSQAFHHEKLFKTEVGSLLGHLEPGWVYCKPTASLGWLFPNQECEAYKTDAQRDANMFWTWTNSRKTGFI